MAVEPGWVRGVVTIQYLGERGTQVNIPVDVVSEMFYVHPYYTSGPQVFIRNKIVYTGNSFKSQDDDFVVVFAKLEYF